MADTTFPTLSEDGWVSSPLKIADYLLSHFFAADYSQSYAYESEVSSFSYIIQKNGSNLDNCASEVQSKLKSYFLRYFNNVVAEVQHQAEAENSSRIELKVYVNFTDASGRDYSLGRLLRIQDTIVKSIIDINNGV